MSRLCTLSLWVAVSVAGPVAAGDTDLAAPWLQAITEPSEDLMLAFTRRGTVAKVLVREGDRVKAGQPLVQLDDAMERVQLSLLKAKAENVTAIKAARLRLERTEALLKKVQEAYDANAAPEREIEDARIDVAMARLDLELAQFNHDQDVGRHEEARLGLARMALVSPVAGEVERIYCRRGEVVGGQERGVAKAGVVRVVRIAPLWVDVPAPTATARKLARGQTAQVRFPGRASPVAAKILRVSKVADAASNLLMVRLEVPNPTARPAGENVTVRLPGPIKSLPKGTARRASTAPASQ